MGYRGRACCESHGWHGSREGHVGVTWDLAEELAASHVGVTWGRTTNGLTMGGMGQNGIHNGWH
eukprot:2168279-Prymnesium_polylepis.1